MVQLSMFLNRFFSENNEFFYFFLSVWSLTYWHLFQNETIFCTRLRKNVSLFFTNGAAVTESGTFLMASLAKETWKSRFLVQICTIFAIFSNRSTKISPGMAQTFRWYNEEISNFNLITCGCSWITYLQSLLAIKRDNRASLGTLKSLSFFIILRHLTLKFFKNLVFCNTEASFVYQFLSVKMFKKF